MTIMKTTTFFLTKLTDAELSRLMSECNTEQKRREERKTAERKKWIENYFFAYLNHPNATAIQVGNTTVVAAYERDNGMHIGTAKPVHGDVFDEKVGVAVAYAKAFNTRVPDFI